MPAPTKGARSHDASAGGDGLKVQAGQLSCIAYDVLGAVVRNGNPRSNGETLEHRGHVVISPYAKNHCAFSVIAICTCGPICLLDGKRSCVGIDARERSHCYGVAIRPAGDGQNLGYAVALSLQLSSIAHDVWKTVVGNGNVRSGGHLSVEPV